MLFFVVYGCLSPHLSPKSSLRNRTKSKRIFFLVFPLFSHFSTHSYFCFGPSRLSSSLHLHPPLRLLNPESLPLSILVSFCASQWNYIFNWNPWSLCRCPQPGAETGAYQQPRCICHSLWCPCYVKWSGWGPASCRSKVVSTPWKDHKEAVSMITLQQDYKQNRNQLEIPVHYFKNITRQTA